MKPWTINNSMGTAQQTAGKLLVMVMALLPLTLPVGAWANPPLPVNVSGYEFLLGTNCTIAGQPATCGVHFGGWTGGNGPDAVSGDRSRVVEGKCELHGERRVWCHSPLGKRQL